MLLISKGQKSTFVSSKPSAQMPNWSPGEGFVMCLIVPVEHLIRHILAAVMMLKLNRGLMWILETSTPLFSCSFCCFRARSHGPLFLLTGLTIRTDRHSELIWCIAFCAICSVVQYASWLKTHTNSFVIFLLLSSQRAATVGAFHAQWGHSNTLLIQCSSS